MSRASEIEGLSNTEHRILQVLLNLGGPVSADTLNTVIRIGNKKPPSYHAAGRYVYVLRKKIAPDWRIAMTRRGRVGYTLVLPRMPPLRDRSDYMRTYRKGKAGARLNRVPGANSPQPCVKDRSGLK